MKKLVLLTMAVGALAAPVAQADEPLITDSLGGAAGTMIAESSNTITVGSGGARLFTCSTINLDITLTENTNLTADGHATGVATGNPDIVPATHTGDCGTNAAGITFRITSLTVNTIHLEDVETTGAEGTAAFSFTYDLVHDGLGGAIIAECTFSGAANLAGETNTDELNLAATLSSTSGGLCPPEGTLIGDFTLTDELGGEAIID